MSAQLSGKGRKTKTAEIPDGLEIKDMSETDLKSVLDEVVNHRSYRPSKSSSSERGPKSFVSKLFEKETEKINQEEETFGGSLVHTVGQKHSHGFSSSVSRVATLPAEHNRSRENESKFEGNHYNARPQVQQSLGSAGSSKASSNASDESEEMDASGMNSNYGRMDYDSVEYSSRPSVMFLECTSEPDYASDFQRNYHHDMHGKEHLQSKEEGNRGRSLQYNSRNNGDRSNANNRGYDEDYREREYQGSTRMSFHHNPQLSSRPNGNRSGSQSDPQHYHQIGGSFSYENEKYLKKKQGRRDKLMKLSKYQSKKTDLPSSSQDSKAYEKVYNDALLKNASLDGIALLDYLSAEKQKLEKAEASKKLSHSASAPAETSPGSRSKKKSSPDSPSKSFASMSTKNGLVRGEGKQKARKAKVSDTESSHGSDQEMDADTTVRSTTRLAAFPKHSRSLNLDASPEMPVSCSITQQSGWENDIEATERENLGLCSPSTGEQAFSSGRSSHSSDDRCELEVGTYIRLEDAEADVDDVEKLEAAVVGKIDKQKKKKKKSKKKKTSPEQSKELPRKEHSLPSSLSAPSDLVVPSSPPSSIPIEVLPVPRPKTPVSVVPELPVQSRFDQSREQSPSTEQPPETEFQVVTRRVSAKTSPTKSHSTPHNYPAPNRQNNVRNRMSQPPPRISKQPAVAVVPVTALEFPTLRRRNSAGDIKKGLADPVPDRDTGDISDVESVASMPVLNKKKGSKTTSAPATRLPTPGISYADIAKGNQNGGSHNNSLSDTHAVDSSPEKSVPKDGVSEQPTRSRTEKSEVHEDRETQTVPVLVPEVQLVQTAPVVAPTGNDLKPKDGLSGNTQPNFDHRNHQQQQFRPKNFTPRGPLPPLHNGPPPSGFRNGPPMMHQNNNNNMQPRNLVARQSFSNQQHGRPMAPPQNFSQGSGPVHQGINLPPQRFNQPQIPFQYSQGHQGHPAPAHFIGAPVMHQLRGVSPPAQPAFLDPRSGQPVSHPQVFQLPPPRPEHARMYQAPPPGYNGEMWPNGPPMPVQMTGAIRQEPPPPHNYACPPNGLIYGSAQSFYPDIGCSHNVDTRHTHTMMMRIMKPAPPLAQYPGPGIYPRSRVNVPPPPPPTVSEEENNQWIGKKSMIFRNSQQPIYVEQAPVALLDTVPEVKDANQIQHPINNVEEEARVQEAPKMILRTAAEIYAFMKDRFEAARQKCIDGAPGCQYYHP